jgi:hypothetical protein
MENCCDEQEKRSQKNMSGLLISNPVSGIETIFNNIFLGVSQENDSKFVLGWFFKPS